MEVEVDIEVEVEVDEEAEKEKKIEVELEVEVEVELEVDEEEEKKKKRKIEDKKSHQYPSRVIQLRGSRPQGPACFFPFPLFLHSFCFSFLFSLFLF